MFSSRKPLAIAVAVVMILAMLVPAAMAAPEWVHGVEITAPTTAAPVYIDTDNPDMDSFDLEFDLTIVGTQVNNIQYRSRALDGNMNWWSFTDWIPASDDLHEGVNPISVEVFVGLDDGWYTIEVCARDTATWVEFCDAQPKAMLVDSEDPGAYLVTPADGAWLNGSVLLVGKAWDPWWAEYDPLVRYGGIVSTAFSYCAEENWMPNGDCGVDNISWITIAAGTATPGIPDQYQATWDSTKVPDEFWARVRFCATDIVGRTACDWHVVFVNNRFSLWLQPGWNLISTPLILNDADMDAALSHLVAHGSVKDVFFFENGAWKKWVAGDTTKLEDGKGYWINMKAADTLTFVGSWKSVGPIAPPSYPVAKNWNLIGYTHWGQPTYWDTQTVADYLGMPLAGSVQSMWMYDVWSQTYYELSLADHLSMGAGYWLALADAGIINP